MNRIIVLAICGIAAILITVFSIAAVTGSSNRLANISKSDKVGMVDNKAEEVIKSGDIDKVNGKSEELTVDFMQSPKISGDSLEYTVRSGDSLYAIARRYNTTVGLIKKMNNLKSDTIRIGQKLKVNTGTFSLVIDKSDNTLVLKKNENPVKTYEISTGKNNSTPVGVFKITDKVIGAPWTRPDGKIVLPGDPDYELGARWMAIDEPGYGIHGTNDENSIGGQVTAGCVRMHNNDVVELYDIVTVGTEVEIVD